ncbi:DUF4390 domain-containing protein [Fundidesulfovibrio soli]|uniref:DUF4390 domain-containing protein n=1 Tax=Fundidesulfovibrio soli TaxID=2922716 RepID=UPI001FAE7BDE|nr:DUF4390 domain-containing protein [Fundidesulfovibrio soli]
MRRIVLLLILFLVSGLAAWPGTAHAQRITLTNLVVDNQEGRVKVRFGLGIKAEEAVHEALTRGEVLALECKAVLGRKRDYVWNKDVARAEMSSELVLHEGGPYQIVLPSKRQEHYRGRDVALLMKEAWGTLSMDLGEWSQMERGFTYSLSLEIRLVRREVPEWVKNTVFFWNFDLVPPVKYQLDFSY